ncbi:MAG: hypothetical protein RL033_1891 [Pseudomonadota bacterium]|jgi:hypothetical protein
MANILVCSSVRRVRFALVLCSTALCSTALFGCSKAEEVGHQVTSALETDISGRVVDDRGEPVEGMSIRLYGLLDNTQFVEGGDVRSGRAYIDREAILASNNTLGTTQTDADGRFRLSEIPNAFLAVAVKEDCSPAFAGFDETTGVLSVDTLITPNLGGGLNFEIPTFRCTCSEPPVVSAQGNADDAPPFEPPPSVVSCDAASCTASGGTCSGQTCVVTCGAAACAEAGGSCVGGACVTPACNPSACATAGGACSMDGSTCQLPACTSNADCEAGQPGAFCENAGDVVLAACHAPLPGEICPPVAVEGWTGFRITDSSGALLADASTEGKRVPAIPADGIVRVYGAYGGAGTKAFVQVQSGGASCANAPPRTDFVAANVVGGGIVTDKGGFLELALHGGQQRLQLSTSETLGVGERSFVVELGQPCAPPAHAFTAILTWDAGVEGTVDLDLNVWNSARRGVCVGRAQEAWGKLKHSKGPGPEVFESDDVAQGPFTIKVQSFCGPSGAIQGKLRVIRTLKGQLLDESFVFEVERPGDVAEIGVFAAE